MSSPFVSICIPVYNRAAFIGETLESVLRQSFEDYEVVIVDNCSTDRTEETVAAFTDPRIRFIRNKWNIGAAGNVNRTLMEAKGSYFKILHSDDRFIRDDALEQMVGAARSHPEAALVTCGYRFSNGPQIAFPFDVVRPKGFSTVREVLNVHMIGLPSEWMIRREALLHTGLFVDPYIGDVELAMKLSYDFGSYMIAGPLIEHRLLEGSETSAADKWNGWEYMKFRMLPRLPFAGELSNGQKAVLSSFLQMALLSKIRLSIRNEAYHAALQSVFDIIKGDPYLQCYIGEDRERALQLMADQLTQRRPPREIEEQMAGQRHSRPYADFFRTGTAFNYRLYALESKLKGARKKIGLVGTGAQAKLFLDTFPELKPHVGFAKHTGPDEEAGRSFEGIPVIRELKLDVSDSFVVLASEEAIRVHRYELINAGLTEGEHFLPVLELL